MSERTFRIVVVVLLAGWLAVTSWQTSRQASNGRFQYNSGSDGRVIVLDTRTGGFYTLDDRKNANGETMQGHSVYMNLSTGEMSVVPFNTANYMEQYGKLKPIPNK